MSAEPIKVAILQRNASDQLHIALDHYLGRNLVDVRIFSPWSGTLGPTKKGVTVTPAMLDDLIAALTEAKAQAAARGWL